MENWFHDVVGGFTKQKRRGLRPRRRIHKFPSPGRAGCCCCVCGCCIVHCCAIQVVCEGCFLHISVSETKLQSSWEYSDVNDRCQTKLTAKSKIVTWVRDYFICTQIFADFHGFKSKSDNFGSKINSIGTKNPCESPKSVYKTYCRTEASRMSV